MTAILIPVYDKVDMLDVAGPMEMFLWAGMTVDLVAAEPATLQFRNAFSFVVSKSFADVADTHYDALWTPGGDPAALACQINDPKQTYLNFLRDRAGQVQFTCSVCEGATLLAAAGLLDGYKVTTHWAFTECLKVNKKIKLAKGHPRWVRDRNRLTGAGISAGLDTSLELIRLLMGKKVAKQVQLDTQYFPDPPVSGTIPKSTTCPIPAPQDCGW